MKKGYLADERIVLQRRKIGSDAFGIMFCGLLISVLVQQFVFDAPFAQYAVELVILLVGSLYVLLGNILVGNNPLGEGGRGQKTVVLNSLVTGLAVAAIATVLNTINYGPEKMGGPAHLAAVALITFACGAVPAFLGFELLYLISKKRQKQLEDKYNSDP